jgi:hypothetical protein
MDAACELASPAPTAGCKVSYYPYWFTQNDSPEYIGINTTGNLLKY